MIKLNYDTLTFGRFPNRELNIDKNQVFEALKKAHKKDCEHVITLKYENDLDLFNLYMLTSFIRQSIKNEVIHLEVLCFPYSRMDRSENGSPFTLKYVADFINSLNFQKVTIYESHSDVTPALINNCQSVSIIYHFLSEVLTEINFNTDEDYIIFPDATANKRYSGVNAKHTLTGLKHRNFETGKIDSLELAGKTPSQGFNALMLDDLCSYGGTFMLTATKLKEMGANKIYLFTGHCEDSIFDGKIFKSDLIEKVFTTNSLLTKEKYWNNVTDRLHVFDIENGIKLPKTATFN